MAFPLYLQYLEHYRSQISEVLSRLVIISWLDESHICSAAQRASAHSRPWSHGGPAPVSMMQVATSRSYLVWSKRQHSEFGSYPLQRRGY